MATVEEWEHTLRFYHKLIDEYGWRQGPMFEFLTWVSSSNYAHSLFPNTSHKALGLSTVRLYEERLRRPMVYIVYSSEEQHFVIHWQRGQGDKVFEESVESPQAPEVISRILVWLGVTDASLGSATPIMSSI
jgi:hypothetical protein